MWTCATLCLIYFLLNASWQKFVKCLTYHELSMYRQNYTNMCLYKFLFLITLHIILCLEDNFLFVGQKRSNHRPKIVSWGFLLHGTLPSYFAQLQWAVLYTHTYTTAVVGNLILSRFHTFKHIKLFLLTRTTFRVILRHIDGILIKVLIEIFIRYFLNLATLSK